MRGELDAFPAGWDLLPKDRIHHCHCKNAVKEGTGKIVWSPVDKGYIDWAAQFRALKQAGYRGCGEPGDALAVAAARRKNRHGSSWAGMNRSWWRRGRFRIRRWRMWSGEINEEIRWNCVSVLRFDCWARPVSRQVKMTHDQILFYTSEWKGERFPDGRPKLPDSLLKRAVDMTIEDVWEFLRDRGYRNQFEGGWQALHIDKPFAGRALTAQYMPTRPDMTARDSCRGQSGGTRERHQ